MERWTDKVAIVTDADSRVGAALSLRLANQGLKVVTLARIVPALDELALQVTGRGSINARQCDISMPKHIEAAFQWVEQKFGGVDIVFNNAEVFKSGRITDLKDNALTDAEVKSIIDINFKGMMTITRHAISSMKQRNVNGHIININGLPKNYVPFDPMFNIYPSIKHAAASFTSALTNELVKLKSKIKVTSIFPALVVLSDTVTEYKEDIPILKPEIVADSIIYLLSAPPNVNISELVIQPIELM